MARELDDAASERLENAVAELAAGLSYRMAEGMSHFTCPETNVILAVLVAAGHVDAAATALLAHAIYFNDEPETEYRGHERLVEAYNSGNLTEDPVLSSQGDGWAARTAALEYLRDLSNVRYGNGG
jgi:hypothetical protein